MTYRIKFNKITLLSLINVVGLCLIVSTTLLSQQSDSPSIKDARSLYYDSPSIDIARFFLQPKKEYHIRYDHILADTIVIPDSCVLYFEGGSIAAPIKFNDTRLSGQIRLKGSSISGSVTNDVFDASWLCNMDGKTDDAKNINHMIEVSNNIFFPSGDYYLESTAIPSPKIPKSLHSQLISHIGINKSNVSLFGQDNTRFISETPIIMICAYSPPYQIDNSVSNLRFQNITFIEKNDKENFHEFAHTLKLVGVNDCTISNCRFEDFWGDAITLGHYGDTESTGERTRNQDIKIMNNYITGKGYNNRNGISIINGKNVSILNNTIDQVSSRKMPGAIDVEANNAAYTVEDITIAYNKINGSNGGVGAISIVSQNNAPAHRILIENNIITNSVNGISFVIKSDDCVSDISVINNTVDDKTHPFKFIGKARTKNWIVKDNTSTFDNRKFGGDIKIDNLILE